MQIKFALPKSPLDLQAEELPVMPFTVLHPATLPKVETGTHYGDIVGMMMLVMSASHGARQNWHSVPYHYLFFSWVYRELGIRVQSPLYTQVPSVEVNLRRLNSAPNPESITFPEAEQTINQTVRHLINEGFLLVIRDGLDDHLLPTEKLVAAIVKQ